MGWAGMFPFRRYPSGKAIADEQGGGEVPQGVRTKGTQVERQGEPVEVDREPLPQPEEQG